MIKKLRPAAIAALFLTVGGSAALAEGDLFIRELSITAEQAALHAPRPSDPRALEEALAEAVMREGNARRAEIGLGTLSPDQTLADAARRYSQKMRDMAFFAHDAPDGETLEKRLPAGEKFRYSQLGENLWSGQGALDWRAGSLSMQATEDWILSPSHRDNLLEPAYEVAGVGVAVDLDQVFVTMLYARPQIDAASARLGAIYAAPPADLYSLTGDVEREALSVINGARSELALSPLAMDAALASAARSHAEATLAAGGLPAASAQTGPIFRQVLNDPANRTSALSMLNWEASGGIVWEGASLSRAALRSWRKQGASMTDLLNSGYSRAGIGAASDGSRVFVSVLLSETSDPFAQTSTTGDAYVPVLTGDVSYTPESVEIVTSGEPLSVINAGTLSTLSGGSYVTLD